MEKYLIKAVSSDEKVFIDTDADSLRALGTLTVFADETARFQLVFTADTPRFRRNAYKCELVVEGDISAYAKLYNVEQVPVRMPVYMENTDADYVRVTPGLYPDPLIPRIEGEKLAFVKDEPRAVFVKISSPDGLPAGSHKLVFKAVDGEETLAETSVEVFVIGEKLGKLPIYHTEWFHADCLAQYYNVECWSERHWEIVESFLKTAAECHVNTILTPVFTPPLDTAVGGERLTTQLVDVYYKNGEYTFGFDKLARWVDVCHACGIEYFEICHFFTQWGAGHAPKIMAHTDSGYRKIFGWETEAAGEEYSAFLRAFIPELLKFFEERGLGKKLFFHISDEPQLKDLENYTKARKVVSELLKGYTVIDALSKYEFYETGVVDKPIPATNHTDEFIEHKVPDLWVYYCCSQYEHVSNRFLSMPGRRTRVIGAQMYKYDVKGFLHWGFNFYNSRYSIKAIDPYLETCGEYFTPAGDCFLVYPSRDGKAYSSLHCEHFVEGLDDLRALKKCEERFGREKTLELLENAECELTFTSYPKDDSYLTGIRQKIRELFAK